ncbi:lysozyme inhibitor LprI family protein [Celeribacter sp. ULVN23_4]
MKRIALLAFLPTAFVAALPVAAIADPSLECAHFSSQVEIGNCVAEAEANATRAMELTLGFAKGSAEELDGITGRAVALPALEASQTAWEAYRDTQCDFVGAGFGGGSGTGIAITSCRVELTRARTKELNDQLR